MHCRFLAKALLIAALVLVFPRLYGAEITLSTETWPHSPEGFSQMQWRVLEKADENLLSFSGGGIIAAERFDDTQTGSGLGALTDKDCARFGDARRVWVNKSQPATITFYLGAARSIRQVRVFTANDDSRANQDYEARFVNNSAAPGQTPSFDNAKVLSTGDTIIGPNAGEMMSCFSREGGNLFDEKYDWVQFTFWPTGLDGQNTAGQPAKQDRPEGWSCALVEIQVLMDLNDEGLFASDSEKQRWLQERNRLFFERGADTLGYEMSFALRHLDSLPMAVEDMIERFGDDFDPKDYLQRCASFKEQFAQVTPDDAEGFKELIGQYADFRREVLLSNPLLDDFDEILMRESDVLALEQNWMSNATRPKQEYVDSLVAINPRSGAKRVILDRGPKNSFVGDLCLHWDGDKCLMTGLSENNTWQVFQCDLTSGAVSQVTPDMGGDVDNVEGCYVPDGSTIFVSSASMMGVPCIGGSGLVGNIYRMEADGKTVRQLTFEQDQDWCPTILPNGRILYLRWEYVDTPHYFARILFTMNPDGTNQVEHYGSGSFWPNSLFYCKPIPGQSSKFVGIVSGHHGLAREGELVVFDPALGRQETAGVVQRIPGHGQTVEPTIADQLVADSWPRFLFPYPLDDTYFLTCSAMDNGSQWEIYLVDLFDNMLKICSVPGRHLTEPIPLMEREAPQVIKKRTVDGAKDAKVFITDMYFGQGLPDVPVGTVKTLRLFAYSYGYRGIGGHDIHGMESCWDGRRILGEVPVFPDGSATFKIPANTPISIQPLDENGAAVQLMRSWFVGMPGESESCIGCHETQNSASPGKLTEARNAEPVDITPFYGPERPFTFEGEVQPVLDRYCVGCHDGSQPDRPNFADTSEGPRHFSKAYHALMPYVRRPGPESDIHTFKPMEYHVSTSELIQMLEKGHHNVKLDSDALRHLYCWIDLNVPYFGTWTEIAEANSGQKGTDPLKGVSDRYVDLRNLYADAGKNYESDSYRFEKEKKPVEFLAPEEVPEPDRSAPAVANWPFTVNDQPEKRTITVDDVSFDMVKIPAGSFVMGDEEGFLDELPRCAATIDKPFWMMTTEVTNALYRLFDAEHDSRFIDQWNKDHNTPGYPANKPEQPVIRISWNRAVDFCAWLSEKTGKHFRLPTEAEWEWAARGGSDSPMWYGALDTDFGTLENLSDDSTRLFVVAGVSPEAVPHQDWEAFFPRANGINDGNFIAQAVGQYKPNPFGLCDILGSVCEWTASDYRPYPYKADDGRNAGDQNQRKVARGGSWADRPKWARCGVRKPYQPWQPVYNVGIRAVCDDE